MKASVIKLEENNKNNEEEIKLEDIEIVDDYDESSSSSNAESVSANEDNKSKSISMMQNGDNHPSQTPIEDENDPEVIEYKTY